MAPNNYEVDTFISSWAPTAALCEELLKLLVFFCVIEHQKNTRRTPEGTRNARRTQKNPEGEEHQPPLEGAGLTPKEERNDVGFVD